MILIVFYLLFSFVLLCILCMIELATCLQYMLYYSIRTCIAGRSWGRSAGRPSPCFSVPLGGKLPVWPSHGLPKWSVTVPAVIRPDGKKENSRAAKELLPDFFPLLLSSPQALCPSFSISPSHILFWRNGFFPSHRYFRSPVFHREAGAVRRPQRCALLLFREG